MITHLRFEFTRYAYASWLKFRAADGTFHDYPLAEYLASLLTSFTDMHLDFIISDGQAYAWYEQRDIFALPDWCQPLAKAYALHHWTDEDNARRGETTQMAIAELDNLCPEVQS